jgi:hypothetical protein
VRASCTSVVFTMSAALSARFAHSASSEMHSASGCRGPAGTDSGLLSEGHAAPLAAVCSVLQQFLRQDAQLGSMDSATRIEPGQPDGCHPCQTADSWLRPHIPCSPALLQQPGLHQHRGPIRGATGDWGQQPVRWLPRCSLLQQVLPAPALGPAQAGVQGAGSRSCGTGRWRREQCSADACTLKRRR